MNEHMNLTERAIDMRVFFDRKADGYDDVHRSFMETKTAPRTAPSMSAPIHITTFFIYSSNVMFR